MASALKVDQTPIDSVIHRLSRLADLHPQSMMALREASADAHTVSARRDVELDGGRMLVLSGWAAKVRMMPDGRRQIIEFVLPGECLLDSVLRQSQDSSSVVAISDLMLCPAPSATRDSSLLDAYAVSDALQTIHLVDNVTRLGRMTAQERICDLFLEFLERLQLAGLTQDNSFALPLTQEVFSDAVGLTPVHLNRTLQACRAQKELDWRRGRVWLAQPEVLARRVGRHYPSLGDHASRGRPAHGRSGGARHGQFVIGMA